MVGGREVAPELPGYLAGLLLNAVEQLLPGLAERDGAAGGA